MAHGREIHQRSVSSTSNFIFPCSHLGLNESVSLGACFLVASESDHRHLSVSCYTTGLLVGWNLISTLFFVFYCCSSAKGALQTLINYSAPHFEGYMLPSGSLGKVELHVIQKALIHWNGIETESNDILGNKTRGRLHDVKKQISLKFITTKRFAMQCNFIYWA